MIVALAGGVGGGRMAAGLAAVLPPRELTVVVNTGDDFEHMGFTICPDLDSVMYAVAGVNNPQTGWGRAGETWAFMDEIKRCGGEGWFNLGDRDLAVHVLRREALRRGATLSEVTRDLCTRFGIEHAIVPMSDMPVRTRVKTKSQEHSFQDYFVRLRCKPHTTGFRFAGARAARVPLMLQRSMESTQVEAVVFCPSNPFVSISPILAVPAIRAWLKQRKFPVTAVSPIVGGAAVKGPAAKMMRELGLQPSTLALVRHYGDAVDRWVIDRQDARQAAAIERLGKRVLVTDTLMTNRRKSAALARCVINFALKK
ncbi:MAG: 2-phospho-L-lactate transferase [Betaproteobacteria bacterium]|nr:2-phospho-L-lactate transferase [Betaproteobacteria bacterium]